MKLSNHKYSVDLARERFPRAPAFGRWRLPCDEEAVVVARETTWTSRGATVRMAAAAEAAAEAAVMAGEAT